MNVPNLTTPNNNVSSLVRALRDDFPGAALDPIAWQVVGLGEGQTISLAGGELNLASGTTPGAETVIMSRFCFTVPFRVWFIGRLSQRIANQEWSLEAVNAAGDMLAQWLFDGTSATQGKYGVANAGVSLVSAPTTITSTAADTIFEIQLCPDEVWFGQRAADSAAGKTQAYVLHRNIPDPNEAYYLRLRMKNGGVAPASSTTMTIGAVTAQDVNELTTEITGGQGDSAGGKAVAVAGTVGLSAGTAAVGHFYQGAATTNSNALSAYKLLAAAGVNATNLKSSAGRVYGWGLANLSAGWRFVKIYNKASSPVVGTDVPLFTIPIPPGGTAEMAATIGVYCSAGIGIGVTTGHADADTGAVADGDVVGVLLRS